MKARQNLLDDLEGWEMSSDIDSIKLIAIWNKIGEKLPGGYTQLRPGWIG